MKTVINSQAYVWSEQSDLVLSPPAAELLYPGRDDYFWPEEVRNNQQVILEAMARQKLSNALQSLFTLLADVGHNIPELITSGQISALAVAEIYNQLADFIKAQPYQARLLLYLPFEMIPGRDWQIQSEELKAALNNFSCLYLEKWQTLLSEHDVRAYFNDGDILEQPSDLSPSLVSKAAHLIPILVSTGLLTVAQVFNLLAEESDQIRRDSILDTILVLSDLGLLTETDLAIMLDSSNRSLHNLAVLIKRAQVVSLAKPGAVQTDSGISGPVWLNARLVALKKEIALMRSDPGQFNVPTDYLVWREARDADNSVECAAGEVAQAFLSGHLSAADLQGLVSSRSAEIAVLLYLDSWRQVLIHLVRTNVMAARKLPVDLEDVLARLWTSDSIKVRQFLEKLCLHGEYYGIWSEGFLSRLGIKCPKPDQSACLNLKERAGELTHLQGIIQILENSPVYSAFFYPAFVIYGSRIKGYGLSTADVDLAVFIKPGVSFSARAEIQNLLSELFKNHGQVGKILEFWLADRSTGLPLLDLPGADKLLGNSAFAHVLFNGAFLGRRQAVKYLYDQLMTGYLYVHPANDKQDRRKIWLSEIERDLLLCRLLQKSYAQIFPPQGGLAVKHAADVDGASAFWDSGYRRLATQLFIDKVFLPQIKRR